MKTRENVFSKIEPVLTSLVTFLYLHFKPHTFHSPRCQTIRFEVIVLKAYYCVSGILLVMTCKSPCSYTMHVLWKYIETISQGNLAGKQRAVLFSS